MFNGLKVVACRSIKRYKSFWGRAVVDQVARLIGVLVSSKLAHRSRVIIIVVRDDHLFEQFELFDAGHELIDRLGLDRVLLICNSVCARAGKSVLA